MRHFMMTATALLALAGCGGPATPEAERGNLAGAASETEGGNRAGAAQPRWPLRTAAARCGATPISPACPRASPLIRGSAAPARVQFGGSSEEGEMRVMGFRTADPPAAVVAFYAEAAQRAGFRQIHRLRSGPSEVLGLERANGDVMNVTATAAPGATNVQIMAGRGRGRR